MRGIMFICKGTSYWDSPSLLTVGKHISLLCPADSNTFYSQFDISSTWAESQSHMFHLNDQFVH